MEAQDGKLKEHGIKFVFAGTQKDDPTKLHTVMQFPNMEALKAFKDDKELAEKEKEAGAVLESAVMIPISDEHLTNYPDALYKSLNEKTFRDRVSGFVVDKYCVRSKFAKDVASGSKFKKSLTGNYYKKYGMQVVNKSDGHPVRAGEQSIRFELRAGDCGKDKDGNWNDCKTNRERHELSARLRVSKGDRWYAWSIYMPEDFVNVEKSCISYTWSVSPRKKTCNLDV